MTSSSASAPTTALLQRLVPNKAAPTALLAGGVNLQVVAAEDPVLDAEIRGEDPSSDLIAIPGFSGTLVAESMQDWPLVWFPLLGENREALLRRVALSLPENSEVCPVLPHPSRSPRRADVLMNEYRELLFDTLETPVDNVMYADERNPFEVYRQVLGAMRRCRESMRLLGGPGWS